MLLSDYLPETRLVESPIASLNELEW